MRIASGLKVYEVVGPCRVFERERGERFTASLTLAHERRLIEGGHIKVVGQDEPRKVRRPTRGGASTPRR